MTRPDSAGLSRALRGQLQRPFVRQKIASFTVVPSAADLSSLVTLAEAGNLTAPVDRTTQDGCA